MKKRIRTYVLAVLVFAAFGSLAWLTWDLMGSNAETAHDLNMENTISVLP